MRFFQYWSVSGAMFLKILSSLSRYNFQRIILGGLITTLASCSSHMQRFSARHSSAHTQTTEIAPAHSEAFSQGEAIRSSELPPVETSGISESAPYAFQERGIESSDGRIMGTPPRNLGTLPRGGKAPTLGKSFYIVQSGDTLSSIARQKGVTTDALRLANGMSHNSVYIGQKLIIPSTHTATVVTGHKQIVSSTNQALAQREFPVKGPAITSEKTNKSRKMSYKQVGTSKSASDSVYAVDDSNNIATPQATGISKMRWPVRGRLLASFGQKKGRGIKRGIDIAVPEGSSVKAAENGLVIYASDGLKALGHVVMIRHEDDIVTIYGHNSRIVVHKGQRVRRGDEIAKSGVSGDVETPRVYFEVRKSVVPVDPIEYLEK